MGKVHRIKRAFNKAVAQDPLGRHNLGYVSIHIGKSYGVEWLYATVRGHSYEKLVLSLMREYNKRAV